MDQIVAFFTTAVIGIVIVAIIYQLVSKSGGTALVGATFSTIQSVTGNLFK